MIKTRIKAGHRRLITRAPIASRLLVALFILVCTAELWIGGHPILLVYQGQWFSPLAGPVIAGTTLGQSQTWEADYRALSTEWSQSGADHWMWMPLIPWGPQEIDLGPGREALQPPALARHHFLGTDQVGRDVLARLIYGLRIALFFALALTIASYVIAIIIALLSATGPRWLDTLIQRAIEIWSHLPFLYVVIGASVFVRASGIYLLMIMIIFSWSSLSTYLRAALLREKNCDYYRAAELLGLPRWRLWTAHLLPQLSPILFTFVPYTFAGAITSLTILDYLGFGLPPHLPSWGELLDEGLRQPQAYWLVWPVTLGLISLLTLASAIGEASRKELLPSQTREFR